MKTVYSNMRELAQAWATRALPPGGDWFRAGNLKATHSAIFSYGDHFTIAQWLPGGTAIFTEREYSTSTSRHKRIASWALSKAGVPTVSVPSLDTPGLLATKAEQRVQDRLDQAQAAVSKARRARKNKAWFLRSAYDSLNNAALLHRTFATPQPPNPDFKFWAELAVVAAHVKLGGHATPGEEQWTTLDLDPIYTTSIKAAA